MTRILMHRDVPVARIDLTDDGHIGDVMDVSDPDHMPFGTTEHGAIRMDLLRSWWDDRSIPVGREGLDGVRAALGIDRTGTLLSRTMSLSLSDQYWVRMPHDDAGWDGVNFFTNAFAEYIGRLLFGERSEDGVEISSPDLTTDGVLRKRWTILDGRRCLIKGGSEPFMQEPFNEAIATIIMDSQGIENANYTIMWKDDVPFSICDDFIDADTELVTAANILRGIDRPDCDSYRDMYVDRCAGSGLDVRDSMSRMAFIDHIMLNTDRHLGNYGIVRDADTLEWVRPAPIYDTGTSLMCRNTTERIRKSIPSANDDMRMGNRIFSTDLDWLDVDAMYGTLPSIDRLLHSAADDHGSPEMTSERADAVLMLLERRMDGIADMLL